MARIEFFDKDGNKIEGPVGKEHTEITVGRGKAADLRVQNPTVSRVHCKVLFASGNFYLEDMGSSNGTYYNMKKLNPHEPVPLEDGDVFFAGNLEVKFHFDDDDYLVVDGETEPPPPPVDMGMPPEEEGIVVENAQNEENRVEVEAEEETQAAAEPPVPQARESSPPQQEEPAEAEPELTTPEEAPSEEAGSSPVEFGEVRHTVMKQIESVNEDAQRQIDELKARIKEKDDIIAGLQRQVEELRATIERLRKDETNADNGVDIDEMQSLLDRAEAENAQMEDQIDALNSKIKEYEQKLQKMEDLEGQATRAQALQEERDKLAKQVKDLNQQLKAVQQQLEEQKQAGQQVQQEEFDRLVKERDALLEENQRWEDLKKQFEQDLADLKAQRDAMKDQVERLKADANQVEDIRKELHEAQMRVDELTRDLGNARMANRSYIKKVSRLIEENEKLKAGGGGGDDSALKALQQENETLKAEIEKLKSRVDETIAAPKEYLKLRENYENLNELIHQLQTSVEIVNRISTDDSMDAGQKNTQLAAQAEQIRSSVDDFKAELKGLNELLQSMNV